MKLVGDLWCPDVMTGPHAYLRRSQSLDSQIPLALQHRTCIQAGGHIGIYPIRLAQSFDRVYTFEPELENFKCLMMNVTTAKAWNVHEYRAFLGPDDRNRALRKHSKSSGGHQTGNVSGNIHTITIDSFELNDVDAIFLDVEGFEGEILKGAMETIQRCHPLLVLEENGKSPRYGGTARGYLQSLMHPYGYILAGRDGEDLILVQREEAR